MVLYKKIIVITLITSIALTNSCYSTDLSKIDKIKIFYNYDYLFHYGGYAKDLRVEESETREIFNINLVSSKYQSVANEYIGIIEKFIQKHFQLLKGYYQAATDLSMDKKEAIEIYNKTQEVIKISLLPQLPDAIRCMVGTHSSQFIEIAIKLDDNHTAINTASGNPDHTFWKDYYKDDPPPYINPEGVLDDQGVIKYHEWFYESNLKLRVVKQIRDKDGKYYGEIYADYYKLDEYDNLFDKDGNPKHPKEDAK